MWRQAEMARRREPHLQLADDGGGVVGHKQLVEVVDNHLVHACWRGHAGEAGTGKRRETKRTKREGPPQATAPSKEAHRWVQRTCGQSEQSPCRR